MSVLRGIAGFLYEIGLLKRYKRTGWSVAGVALPESVADHSFRAAVIASVLAALDGADPQRSLDWVARAQRQAQDPAPPAEPPAIS